MGLFQRRPRLPAGARPAALEREERVLCWARTDPGVGDGAGVGDRAGAGDGVAAAANGGVLVVTNRGLWLPDGEHRLGWHQVHKAVWSGQELAITAAETVAERDGYTVVADRPVRSYPLPDPGDVPHQVRVRVSRSVAYTAHHRLAGGGLRVVARRVSGVDGFTWTVRYDPDTPSAEPDVVEETDRLVAAARTASTPAEL